MLTAHHDSPAALTRRGFLKTISLASLALPLLAACAPAQPAQPTAAPAKPTEAPKPAAPTSAPAAAPTAAPAAPTAAPAAPKPTTAPAAAPSAALPADAAPKEQQIFRYVGIEGKHFDATKNIYESNGMEGYALEPLVWLDADFNVYPGAADKWEVSKDGLTWTFNLRKNAKWSDGTPVTAEDWVFSLRRMLDPKLANPYGWFYYNIKNAEVIHTGKNPDVTQLGVKKVDDYTLAITTESPIPYFLQVVGFIATIAPRHMIEKYGDAWASDPKTTLSNGPYMVKEWNKGKNVVYVKNPHYEGPAMGKLEQIIQVLAPQGAPVLPMYQANEIDYTGLDATALSQVMANPDLKKEAETYAAFITYYMHFNTNNPPFDNVKVRQAFSHAIDREAISNQVMRGLEVPAYTMLPDGFPCNQASDPKVKAIQGYDPAKAKQLLAEAGYPNGQGFPALEMWTRQGQIVREGEAIQRMLKENLGVNVTPKDVERSLYMDRLRAKEITFGLIQWAQDYSDPTNFLDWWASGSRHTWKNEKFNDLVNRARGELDQAKRCAMYQEAEQILISDVGGVFIGNPLNGELWKPKVAGVRKTKSGVHQHYQKMWSDLYIKKA